MPSPLHPVLPSAPPVAAGKQAGLEIPHLRELLQRLTPTHRIVCAEQDPATPLELALARLHGLPGEPGYTPWAAFESGTVGTPCAWITLCHWHIGMNQVCMTDPRALALDTASTEALLSLMAPYFAEDSIALSPWRPGVLLAKGEVFRELRCVSVERVVGQDIRDWQHSGASPREALLRRLQTEMQMLLYTTPLNDEREAQGLTPVNSFWVSGAGVLSASHPAQPGVVVEPDWPDACLRLLNHLRSGGPGSLTLCGEHAAQSFEHLPRSWRQKIVSKFRPQGIPELLMAL